MASGIPVLAVRDQVHFPGLVNTLHVVREPSLRALRSAMEGARRVLVLSQRDMSVEEPSAEDLFCIGTLSETLQTIPLPDTSLRVALRGLRRVRAARVFTKDGSFWAEAEEVDEQFADDLDIEATMRVCVEVFTKIVQMNKEIPPEALQGLAQIETAGLLADSIIHHLPARPLAKQAILEELDHRARLDSTLRALLREQQVLDLDSKVHQRVEKELGDTQREFYLREQLRVIQDELQEREDRVGETEEYREKILLANMPEAVEQRSLSELRRLDRSPVSSPEGVVVRNYLDVLVSLPWARLTEDRLDVSAAERLLNERHYGLPKVKERILDHLAVLQLRKSVRGPIIGFVGPPGVGKTSVARSIAEAMGRKFVRIPLGGIRDEAEIRGHRRTYVGSMPGRIIQGLRDCGSRNPVVLLDEIDKIVAGNQGDPTSALLEALDPEQNDRFLDHYIEVPFDLSAVLFVGTANLIENVPAALRDRMEVIPFYSYTDEERAQIGRSFLFPRAIEENGLRPDQVSLPDESLQLLISDYTREPGVRNLDRSLATLCRKTARCIAQGGTSPIVLDTKTVAQFLGRPRHRRFETLRADEIGSVWGMVVCEHGGELVTVETSLTLPLGDQPELRLTGNLGDVMKESAQAALTVVRAHIPEAAARKDVHIHVPEGAVPKDGPSAGIAIAITLASAFKNAPIRGNVSVTGEITLRGRVLPVGGIREKVLAAVRAGIQEVILPMDNMPDLDDVPPEALAAIKIHPVKTFLEALEVALALS